MIKDNQIIHIKFRYQVSYQFWVKNKIKYQLVVNLIKLKFVLQFSYYKNLQLNHLTLKEKLSRDRDLNTYYTQGSIQFLKQNTPTKHLLNSTSKVHTHNQGQKLQLKIFIFNLSQRPQLRQKVFTGLWP